MSGDKNEEGLILILSMSLPMSMYVLLEEDDASYIYHRIYEPTSEPTPSLARLAPHLAGSCSARCHPWL